MKPTFLLQPYPAYKNPKRQSFVCLITGIIVAVMLFILKPFGISLFSEDLKNKHSVLYATITFLITLYIHHKLIPRVSFSQIKLKKQ